MTTFFLFLFCTIVIATAVILQLISSFIIDQFMRINKQLSSDTCGNKQGMEIRKKKVSHAIPNMERQVTNSNWETFKDLVTRNKITETNSVKEGFQKKSIHKQHSLKKRITHKHTVESILNDTTNKNIKSHVQNENKSLTKQIAIDCEMVGIGDGTESMIARVSLVNRYGFCVYDKYVKPREQVQDYRTPISGIHPHHLQNGEEFLVVQKEVAEMLKGKILIGHALKNDLAVLYLSHPKWHLRDTSRYKPFRQVSNGRTPSLKKLAYELLGREIQVGEHSSVEDARAAMQLYMLYRNKWESDIHGK